VFCLQGGKEGLEVPQTKGRVAPGSPALEVYSLRLLHKSLDSDTRGKHLSQLCFRRKEGALLCDLNGRRPQGDFLASGAQLTCQ